MICLLFNFIFIGRRPTAAAVTTTEAAMMVTTLKPQLNKKWGCVKK